MNTPALQRITAITAAYDCLRNQPCVHGSDECKPGTGGSHGVHNCELRMWVRGSDAEVLLVIFTGWDLPTVPRRDRMGRRYPNGAYVEFHTRWPMFEGQEPAIRLEVDDDAICKTWDTCYNDRGYLMAEPPTELLVAKGSDAVWAWLEAKYDDVVRQMAAFSK